MSKMACYSLSLALSQVVCSACGGGESLLGPDDGATDSAGGEFSPSIPDAGAPGWRDGFEPWNPPWPPSCDYRRYDSFDIWADPEGVWALLHQMTDTSTGLTQESLAFNSGDGWNLLVPPHECGLCADGLVGRIGPRLAGQVLRPPGAEGVGPPLLFDGAAWNYWSETVQFREVYVVANDLAYAIYPTEDLFDTRIMRWDGATWLPLTAVLPLPYRNIMRIWADEDSLFVAGEAGTVLSLDGESWRVHEVPTVDAITALWAFDGSSVWLGTHGGDLIRYDGVSWTVTEWPRESAGDDPCADTSAIAGLWGCSGMLFLHTATRVLRRSGDEFDVLADWSGASPDCEGRIRIERMRGLAVDEVFFGVVADRASDRCRPFLVRWDGAVFHWM